MATLEEVQQKIIDAMDEAMTDPKPSYDIDGQQVSWSEYYKALADTLKATAEAGKVGGGIVFEVSSQGISGDI